MRHEFRCKHPGCDNALVSYCFGANMITYEYCTKHDVEDFKQLVRNLKRQILTLEELIDDYSEAKARCTVCGTTDKIIYDPDFWEEEGYGLLLNKEFNGKPRRWPDVDEVNIKYQLGWGCVYCLAKAIFRNAEADARSQK